MTYVKIKNQQIEAEVFGLGKDNTWGNRESKSIHCRMTYTEASELFVNNTPWSIIYQQEPYFDPETKETVTPDPIEYDNSEYSVAGAITDHRDGTISIKMGKPTEVESLQAQLATAVTEEELNTAYIEGVNSL